MNPTQVMRENGCDNSTKEAEMKIMTLVFYAKQKNFSVCHMKTYKFVDLTSYSSSRWHICCILRYK